MHPHLITTSWCYLMKVILQPAIRLSMPKFLAFTTRTWFMLVQAWLTISLVEWSSYGYVGTRALECALGGGITGLIAYDFPRCPQMMRLDLLILQMYYERVTSSLPLQKE